MEFAGGGQCWVFWLGESVGFFYLLLPLDMSFVRSMCTFIAPATTGLFSKNHLKLDVTEFLKQPPWTHCYELNTVLINEAAC